MPCSKRHATSSLGTTVHKGTDARCEATHTGLCKSENEGSRPMAQKSYPSGLAQVQRRCGLDRLGQALC